MIYLVRDSEFKKNLKGGNLGGLAAYNAASQFEFWLDSDAVDDGNSYGVIGSAHEFGHALGIPHPWDLPINVGKNIQFVNESSRGDLMGYNNNSLQLKDLFLRDDIKKQMGL